MGYFNVYESEVALNDIKVFNEFDRSNFIANAKSSLSGKNELVNAQLKLDSYASLIEKSINSLETSSIDKEVIKDFISKYNAYQSKDLTGLRCKMIDIDDNTVIKPQYLDQYTNMIQKAIDSVINGNSEPDMALKFMTNEYPVKVKKQIVKTNLPYELSVKDMSKDILRRNNAEFEANSEFIEKKVIPFLLKCEENKARTIAEGHALANSIRETSNVVNAMNKALDKYRTVCDDNAKCLEVNRMSYNSIRGLIDVISFATFVMIKKINNLTDNIISATTMYTDLYNKYNIDTLESAFDRQTLVNNDEYNLGSDLLNGKNNLFAISANDIYEYHKGMIDLNQGDMDPIPDEKENKDNSFVYPANPFENIGKAYILISEGLNIIGREGGDYLLVFDDLIDKSGFSIVLVDRFREEIKSILDTSEYDSGAELSSQGGTNVLLREKILNEVKDYPENSDKLAKIIKETYDKLEMLEERFARNVNGEFKDMQTANELKVFLKDLREQFIDMTNKVGANLYTRLKQLSKDLILIDSDANTANDFVDGTDPVVTSSDIDFSESYYEAMIELEEDNAKKEFNTLQMEYYREKLLASENSKVIFEADEAPANNPTQNAVTQLNQQVNQQNVGKENPSTKPTIVDNSGEKNANGNPSQSSAAKFGNLIQKIQEWFQKTIEGLQKVMSDDKAAKNKKFIADNKDGLMNRSYNNVALKVLPYKNHNFDAIRQDMSKVKSNVTQLNHQTIQALNTKADVYRKLFPFVQNLNVGDGEKAQITPQFMSYFKIGTVVNELQTITVANGELKTYVTTQVIPEAEQYYDSFGKEALSFMQEMSDICKALLTKLNNDNNVTESVVTEADQNDTTKTGLTTKVGWITEAVCLFCGSLINALRERNNDNFILLNGLKVGPAVQGQANVTDGNDTVNQQNQNQNV